MGIKMVLLNYRRVNGVIQILFIPIDNQFLYDVNSIHMSA